MLLAERGWWCVFFFKKIYFSSEMYRFLRLKRFKPIENKMKKKKFFFLTSKSFIQKSEVKRPRLHVTPEDARLKNP
jgi:hypothetical protein